MASEGLTNRKQAPASLSAPPARRSVGSATLIRSASMALAEFICPGSEYFVESEDEDDPGPVERMLMSTDGSITLLLEAVAS